MPYYPPIPDPFDEQVVLTMDPLHGQGLAVAASAGIGVNSVAWPLANLAIFLPVYVWRTITVNALATQFGTSAGNFDIGIYDASWTKIVSTGSTAAAGFFKQVAITATTLTRGTYYLALAHDTNTCQVRRVTIDAGIGRMIGALEQTSAFPLPATATPVAFTRTVFPVFGMTTRATF